MDAVAAAESPGGRTRRLALARHARTAAAKSRLTPAARAASRGPKRSRTSARTSFGSASHRSADADAGDGDAAAVASRARSSFPGWPSRGSLLPIPTTA
eukprot:31117-Pelagococcus_subviridis.AAC.1